MKLLSTILLLTFVFSCSNTSEVNQSATSNDSPINFIKTFEGSIGSEYPITARIKVEGYDIDGQYYYNQKKELLKLKGKLLADHTLEIKEFNEKGHQTGVFKGNLVADNKMTGNWMTPDESRTLSFNLIESDTDFEPNREEQGDSPESFAGHYEASFGNSIQVLDVREAGQDMYSFSIGTFIEQGCTGVLEGMLESDKDELFYTDSECKRLSFAFSDSGVKVSERGCGYYHGARCSFAGNYSKSGEVRVEFD